MASSDERNSTTVAIEMGPGWIYVKIVEPKPKPELIERLLCLTIEQWFSAHPQFVIDKTQAVTDHGVMQGIHVRYHVNDRQSEPASSENPQQSFSVAIEVHNQVFKQLPTEHIEAIVDEAIQTWRSHQDVHGTMVVINPRRIAVILDRLANRGAAVPVELIYPSIEDGTRSRVQAWLERPPNRFHVIQLAGSWFVPHTTGTQRSTVVEPSHIRTNMTYDTRPRPKE